MAGQYPPYPDPTSHRHRRHRYVDDPFNDHDPTPPEGIPVVREEYPAALPPPLAYSKRRSWRLIATIAVVVAVIGAMVGAVLYAVSSSDRRGTAGTLTAASAQVAIQSYLDALSDADIETIARNTMCGMYDGVRDRRADQQLAKLSSDTFRKQFRSAEVTSIDKLVFLSSNQVQVLFTMRVEGSGRGTQSREEQAIAQLLLQDGQVLVCQYLLRGTGSY